MDFKMGLIKNKFIPFSFVFKSENCSISKQQDNKFWFEINYSQKNCQNIATTKSSTT